MLLKIDRYFFQTELVGCKIQQVSNLNTKITNFLKTNICTEVHFWNPCSDKGMFFPGLNIKKKTVLAMKMKMEQLFYVFISFVLKFLYITATHKYFRKNFFPKRKSHLYLGRAKAKTRTVA